MPDVRMPDGTIIRNVPEGTTRAQLQARVNAAKPKSFWQGFKEEIATGANNAETVLGSINPLMRAPRLLQKAITGQDNTTRNKRLDTIDRSIAAAPTQGSTWGRIAGGVLATAPTMMIPGVGGTGLAGRVLSQGATQGAASGALLSRARNAGGVARDVGVGAALGKGGEVVARGVGRLIGGSRVPDNVRRLAQEGITMTPGQRAGPRSIRQFMEDSVMGSIPGVKEIPAAARRRGENDLRVAVANRVVAPIAGRVPRGTPINRQAISGIQDQVYGAYNEAARNLALNIDEPLEAGFDAIRQAGPRMAGPEGAQQIGANADYVTERLLQGELTGQPLVDTMNQLRSAAAGAQGETRAQLGALYDELAGALERQNGAVDVGQFTNAREAVTLLKRMEDAASKSVDGEFGPTQLLQAAKRRGYGTSTANVASGDARFMDLADDAAGVMRNTSPNSGTVPRGVALGALTGGGAASAALGAVDPLAGSLMASSLLGYVPGIDRILQNFALNRPQVLQQIGRGVERASPLASGVAVAGLLNQFGQ